VNAERAARMCEHGLTPAWLEQKISAGMRYHAIATSFKHKNGLVVLADTIENLDEFWGLNQPGETS